MSAFRLHDAHVDAMLNGAMTLYQASFADGTFRWYFGNPTQAGELTPETADRVGAVLLAEHEESLRHLHGGETVDRAYRFTLDCDLYGFAALFLERYMTSFPAGGRSGVAPPPPPSPNSKPRGLVVVDPKGDLVVDVLMRLARPRGADVVLLDVDSRTCPQRSTPRRTGPGPRRG